MPRWVLLALDGGFFVFHSAIILFNVFGWIFPRTRRANLALLLLTLASWLLMGAVYGVGYCVCTDWHFRVREALGEHDGGDNYVGFLVWKLTSWQPPPALVKEVCAVVFVVCLTMSVALNARDWRWVKSARAPFPRKG
jgi:hypothetical protein